MADRATMANYDTIGKAIVSAGLKRLDYNSAYSIYENGMIDVLRQLAITKILEIEAEEVFMRPVGWEETVEKHSALFHKISDLLPEENRPLMSELELAESEMKQIENDNSFITGFIEGYRFLRTLNSSYRSDVLDVRL